MNVPRKRYFIEDFRLEPDSQSLSRAELPIHLPKKPFQVLLYLIEHRERYVSRAELLDAFWEGHEVYDDALRKSVGAIRKALEGHSDKSGFIETRWGVGYRYVGPVEEQIIWNETAVSEIEKTREMRIILDEEEIQSETALKEEPPARSVLAPSLPAPKRTALALVSCAALVVTVVLVLSSYITRPAATEARSPLVRSVAVLPLKNITGDIADEYLSDGITENLITSLSRVKGLKVISRGSAFAFKGKDLDPREVGRLLGVAAVVEGDVVKSGDRVRVGVRLVSVIDGKVLWASETNDRAAGDVFAVQDEVARNVVSGLKIVQNDEERQRLTVRHTDNAEAYEFFLKGRFFVNKRTPEGIEKGIEYFRRAIEIAPNYALAYAGLAVGYDKAFWFHRLPPEVAVSKGKEAAARALMLDDSLAEAHLAMAAFHFNEWDLNGAVREQELAIKLNPDDAEAHHGYAYSLAEMGRTDEALAEITRARELDPLNIVMNVDVGEILLYIRHYDEAVEALKHAIEMDATRANAHYDLAQAYEVKGMHAEAFEEYVKNETFMGESAETVATLKQGYEASGIKGFWQKKLEIAIDRSKERYVAPILFARMYARLGEKDRAFDWLDKAYKERSPALTDLRVDPMLDGLRSDPRYRDLLRRIGLP